MTQQKINHTPATHVPRAFQRATQHPKRWGINRPRPRRVRCGPDQSEHHGLKQASHALKFRLVTSLSIELQNGLSKSMVRALRAGPGRFPMKQEERARALRPQESELQTRITRAL